MSHARPIRVGIGLHPQHTSYDSFADAVRHADEIGADIISNWDHFFPVYGDPQGNHFEAWTTLTAMAMLTRRAKIGCLVTCNSYRNPALLSNMAKTVDHISGGRLILGLGAGWSERDFHEYGYDLGTPGSRLKDLEGAINIIKARWEIDAPRPIQQPIPLLIGGGGEKVLLRIAAQHADVWHGFGDPDAYATKVNVLHEWCAKVGRDPAAIELAVSPPEEYTPELLDAYVRAGASTIFVGFGRRASDDPWNYAAMEQLIAWRDSRG
jgi:probable F420-dependent oxidoreductase